VLGTARGRLGVLRIERSCALLAGLARGITLNVGDTAGADKGTVSANEPSSGC
jgi:hypothetical protein